jgi:SAM-dependent methyltransferase
MAMLDPGVLRFVRESLPPSPARVLEIGAGGGELARALIADGYQVVAIDPASTSELVQPVALHELHEPARSFDAAVAVVALHHVEPLGRSCRWLADLVRPGGTLVVDEIDVERFDERAARWWLEHRPPDYDHDHGHGHEPLTPEAAVAWLRHHCHALDVMEDALAEGFELGPLVRGPYLYRWELGPELRASEEELIAAGALPAVGVRVVGTRRPGPA